MSAGRKANPAKSVPSGIAKGKVAAASGKDTAPLPAGAPKAARTEFAPGTYYRQGVLVPGGPHKAMPRGRSR